ncbi:MAG: DUF1439 domain-containing protein [Dehalococcoidia bacterium]|nr:DUF1439 domain-containing protein [Dehalococcoidia bacterium]
MPKDIRCPLCNSTTVVRIVKKGPDTGRKFHVCTRYPECKGRIKAHKGLLHKGLLHQFRNYKVIIPVILLMIVLFTTVGLILGFNVKVTEEPINKILAAKFHVSRAVGGSMNITLDNARTELSAGEDLILVFADVHVNLKTGEKIRTIEGNAIIRSEVYYDRGKRELYLENSELLSLNIGRIDIEDREKLFAVASEAVRSFLHRYPLYEISINNFLVNIAVYYLRDIRVEDGFILIRVGF